MKKQHIIFLIGAPLLAIILVTFRVYYSAVIWKYPGAEKEFIISPNENFSSINSRLHKEHFIHSARLFHRYSQYQKVINKYKAGRYLIRANSNMLDVYNILINEKSISTMFTIPEGKNMYEIGKMLEERQMANYQEFITLCKDKKFIADLGIEAETLEGYLYPETYDITPGLKADFIIKMMVKQFQKHAATLDLSKTQLSLKDVLIMASIVEKETGDKKERPMVAGVFMNRLNKKMRLQSDPTTVYGIWERYTGNITKIDLEQTTEYNTYRINGLPKGPISNPGILSLQAVLNPALHNYLYFVSMNDGTHVFSESYEKHQEAVRKWQLDTKNREGRSWRNHKDN